MFFRIDKTCFRPPNSSMCYHWVFETCDQSPMMMSSAAIMDNCDERDKELKLHFNHSNASTETGCGNPWNTLEYHNMGQAARDARPPLLPLPTLGRRPWANVEVLHGAAVRARLKEDLNSDISAVYYRQKDHQVTKMLYRRGNDTNECLSRVREQPVDELLIRVEQSNETLCLSFGYEPLVDIYIDRIHESSDLFTLVHVEVDVIFYN